MNHIESAFVEYSDVFEAFGRKKLEKRYEALLSTATIFIEKMGYKDSVIVDEFTLLYTMFDYFSDVLRLKRFHKIGYITEEKITSYEIYWLLKRKPLQKLKCDKSIVYVNEQFAISRIIQCLGQNEKKSPLEFDKLMFFNESLFYFLKYRSFDAKTIEIIMLSFNAGKIYSDVLKKP